MTQHEMIGTLPAKAAAKVGRHTAKLTRLKRYNLSLPEDLFNEVHTLAERRQTTVLELLRRFIKLGLIAARIDESPDAQLIIRENGTERQIVLV